MSFRSSASFGKRQEFVAIAELMRRGLDVYMTLVDDQQIDCINRKEVNGEPVYIDVQIKARSQSCNPGDAGRFAALEVRKPRPNFIFIFYSERADSYWLVPSIELVNEATCNKTGKNAGRYSIVFTNLNKSESSGIRPRPRFEKYRDNFDLLMRFLRASGTMD